VQLLGLLLVYQVGWGGYARFLEYISVVFMRVWWGSAVGGGLTGFGGIRGWVEPIQVVAPAASPRAFGRAEAAATRLLCCPAEAARLRGLLARLKGALPIWVDREDRGLCDKGQERETAGSFAALRMTTRRAKAKTRC